MAGNLSKTILMVTDNIPSQINGVNTTYQNIESYAHLDGYRVVYLDAGQFPHIACPGYPEVKIAWPHGISKKIKALRPDYIHIQTEGPVGLFARWWCERNHIPYNTSYHTDFAKFLKKMYHVPESWTWWYLRWFHKNSHRVLVTTESIQQDLVARGFQNLRVWTRGVDRTIFNSTYRGATVADHPVLLSVGRVSVEKGLDDFCQLDMPGATKIVVGDGPYRQELQRRYPDIDFVGVKKGIELARYYAQADVFVFPSRADTFGVVNIEALACGTPVAAYPVPGPIDIVEPGLTGFLNNNLQLAVQQCLTLDRWAVEDASLRWTWAECWRIFEENLIDCSVV
jgi:glycosyltransferase involved in cell wall biosynthesis